MKVTRGEESHTSNGPTDSNRNLINGWDGGVETVKIADHRKGLSFISNRQRRKEGTFRASGLAGIEPKPARSVRAGYARLNRHQEIRLRYAMFLMHHIIELIETENSIDDLLQRQQQLQSQSQQKPQHQLDNLD